MGNALSEEEETEILEEAYSMSLESPEADKVLNAGTSAPNHQLKEKEQRGDNEYPDQRFSEKHRRNSSNISETEERRKRQHTEQMTAQQQKKLSYIQMAKLGYQELVNAIIRPPRADYKVRSFSCVVDA